MDLVQALQQALQVRRCSRARGSCTLSATNILGALQDNSRRLHYIPEQYLSAAGLLQGLKDGDVCAFKTLSRIGKSVTLDQPLYQELLDLLVPHVHTDAWEQLSAQHHDPMADDEEAAGRGGSIKWWCTAVGALLTVMQTHCSLSDPTVVLEVLQGILQQQSVLLQEGGTYKYLMSASGPLHTHAEKLVDALVHYPHLVTAVLQHSSILGLMAAAPSDRVRGSPAKSMFSKVVAASPLPLWELPEVHGTVCQLLSSGTQQGAGLLSALADTKVQQRLGLWQDPALQAACLEGARRAAAAVAGLVTSSVEQAVLNSDHSSPKTRQLPAEGRGPQLPPSMQPESPESLAASSYARGIVCLLEGQQSAQPSQGSVSGTDLVAAAWQCLLSMVQVSQGAYSDSCLHGPVVRRLLCSPAARQVLLQQPGGVCSLEEVCGVLSQCLQLDDTSGQVEAAVGLLEEPGMMEAALAVPSFVASVVAPALGPAQSWRDQNMKARARLLEALVSAGSGRAALTAEPGALGQVAWEAATCKAACKVYTPHLLQLWAAGGEEGVAGAMVAGLAAGQQGCVKLFSWLLPMCATEEWCALPGLLPALSAAFDADTAPALDPSTNHETPWPLKDVLGWLLQEEVARQLLSSSQQLAAAVCGWLQRNATLDRPSPISQLLTWSTPAAAAAMSFLADSPQLFKGALVSLVTSRSTRSDYDYLVEQWLEGHGVVLMHQVLGDRGLLCALLRAMAAAPPPARARGYGDPGAVAEDEDRMWRLYGVPSDPDPHDHNTSAKCVMSKLPADLLLPQLVKCLAGQAGGDGSSAPAGAAGTTVDSQLATGAWLAIEQIQGRSDPCRQKVQTAMQQLARDAAPMHRLQELQAAGHATWVAAAQERKDLAAQQRQLQQERNVVAAEQVAAEEHLRRAREALAAEQQQLQQEREALRAEWQQLEQLRGNEGRQSKRRHL
jgi:hypothetical protein